MDVLVTCKNELDPIKNGGAKMLTRFSPSVAMETRVLIQSGSKTLCSLSPTQIMLQMKFDFNWPAGLRDIHV